MHPLTTSHNVLDEREASISWLRVKILDGTAGLDENDAAVMVIEVESVERAWRLDLIGLHLADHPHVRKDGTICVQVRGLIEADVRQELGLDLPGAQTIKTPLASRAAGAQILPFARPERSTR